MEITIGDRYENHKRIRYVKSGGDGICYLVLQNNASLYVIKIEYLKEFFFLRYHHYKRNVI